MSRRPALKAVLPADVTAADIEWAADAIKAALSHRWDVDVYETEHVIQLPVPSAAPAGSP